jgi:hypothetical protein
MSQPTTVLTVHNVYKQDDHFAFLIKINQALVIICFRKLLLEEFLMSHTGDTQKT